MATKLTAQLDAVSTCHRHRITPHTAAMLHPLTAAVPFTMLRLSYANLPCHNPHRATHPYQVSTLYTEPRRTQRDAAIGGGCCNSNDRPFLTPTIQRCLPRFWSRRGVPSSPVCTYGLELRHIKRRGGGCSCCTRGGEPVHDKAAICEQKTSGFASQR